MLLKEAEIKAKEIVDALSPFCKPGRIQVCGSIRRKRPTVNDLDIVLIIKDFWGFDGAVRKLAANGKINMNGSKIQRVTRSDGTLIDLYIANDDTWGTTVLIRTGSADHNKRLCTIAKSKGMELRASGEGLVDLNTEEVIAKDEQSIFAALGLKYLEPEDREVTL